MFNKDELIISDVISGTFLDKDTLEVLCLLNDISDPSLSIGSELVYATDHLGVNIAMFPRSKSASLSGSNGLFSLGLLAAQAGTKKNIATNSKKIVVPFKDVQEIGGTGDSVNTTITLTNAPKAGTLSLEVLDNGGSLTGVHIPVESVASASAASVSGKTVTLPTGLDLTADTVIGAFYSYDAEEAVEITNNAKNPTTVSGIFRLEVMFCDKCNQATQYYGYIEFPSAVLSSEADIDLTTDGGHPFTVEAMADYCSIDRQLFRVVVPGQTA